MFIEMKRKDLPTMRYNVGNVARHMLDNPQNVLKHALTADFYGAGIRTCLYVKFFHEELKGVEAPDVEHGSMKVISSIAGDGFIITFWVTQEIYNKYADSTHSV